MEGCCGGGVCFRELFVVILSNCDSRGLQYLRLIFVRDHTEVCKNLPIRDKLFVMLFCWENGVECSVGCSML